jgi:hypothetical protein
MEVRFLKEGDEGSTRQRWREKGLFWLPIASLPIFGMYLEDVRNGLCVVLVWKESMYVFVGALEL